MVERKRFATEETIQRRQTARKLQGSTRSATTNPGEMRPSAAHRRARRQGKFDEEHGRSTRRTGSPKTSSAARKATSKGLY